MTPPEQSNGPRGSGYHGAAWRGVAGYGRDLTLSRLLLMGYSIRYTTQCLFVIRAVLGAVLRSASRDRQGYVTGYARWPKLTAGVGY